MNNILFYISVNTEFKYAQNLIQFIIKNKIGTPFLIFNHIIHNLSKEEDICNKSNIAYLSLNKNCNDISKQTLNVKITPKTSNTNINILNEIKDILLLPIRIAKQIRKFCKIRSYYRTILLNYEIKAVICMSQGISTDKILLISAAKKQKRHSWVFPFAVTSESLENRHLNIAYFNGKRLSNQLSFPLFKRYFKYYKNKKIIAKPPPEAIALRLLGIYPKNPWSAYSGQADLVISESKFMTIFLLNEGLEEKSIKELGNLSLKVKTKQYNNFILCAFPPINPAKSTLPEFEANIEAIHFWFQTMQHLCSDTKIIISLHPRLNSEEFHEILKNYNVTISNDPIENLIPNCKIFITSVSSTIRLAIKHSKPVINYDIFNFQYSHFSKYKGVLTVYNKVDFKTTLEKLINDHNYFNKITNLQKSDSEYFGFVDENNKKHLEFFEKHLS